MSNSRPTRQGPLVPHPAEDSVVVEGPSRDPIVMTAQEADLSAIRMLNAAEEARNNEAKGERSE